MMNRLKIISDGTSGGTRLIDTASGEDVTRAFLISEITWTLAPGPSYGGAEVTLKLRRMPVELESQRVNAEVKGWLDDRTEEWRAKHQPVTVGLDEFVTAVARPCVEPGNLLEEIVTNTSMGKCVCGYMPALEECIQGRTAGNGEPAAWKCPKCGAWTPYTDGPVDA